MGAPVECQVGQNLDNFLTNVQVLSCFCPMFVQVLSMSNICQKNFNFTKFCQIIVHILSKILVIVQDLSKVHFLGRSFFISDKHQNKKCLIFVQVLSMKCQGPATELLVKLLSISCPWAHFCPI